MDRNSKGVIVHDKTGIGSYIGSGIATLLGLLTYEQWGMTIGVLLGIGTFIVNWYYKRRSSSAQIDADQAKARYFRAEAEELEEREMDDHK